MKRIFASGWTPWMERTSARPAAALIEGLFAGTFLLACTLSCIWIVYQEASDAHDSAVHADLRRLAHAAAANMDGDLRDPIRSSEQQDSSEFHDGGSKLACVLCPVCGTGVYDEPRSRAGRTSRLGVPGSGFPLHGNCNLTPRCLEVRVVHI